LRPFPLVDIGEEDGPRQQSGDQGCDEQAADARSAIGEC
jgi:hypothetical protein